MELVYPGSTIFEPLEVEEVRRNVATDQFGSADIDALLTLLYDGRKYRFAVEVSHRTAPSVTSRAIERLTHVVSDAHPLLIAPYLTDDLVKMLKMAGINGADLAGNYVFSTDSLVAMRRDRPNVFPEDTGIRNVYRGVSSIVCRFLLSRPGVFDSVTSVYDGIRKCGGEVSLSTVSKVLSTLEDDLLIEKSRSRIRVLQPGPLLDKLTENYSPPAQTNAPVSMKINDDSAGREDTISRVIGTSEWVWDGSTSAALYIDIAAPRVPVVLVHARYFMMYEVIPGVARYEPRFPNVEIRYTSDREPFFRCERDGHRASVLEAYLSWATLDKRERELAGDLRARILSTFDEVTHDERDGGRRL